MVTCQFPGCRGTGGYQRGCRCDACGEAMRQHQTRSRKRNDHTYRSIRLMEKYGITEDQFDAMFAAQGSVCAICGGIDPCGKNFCVDHCHATGNVRGILCNLCNSGIGKLRDDPVIVAAALEYLNAFWKSDQARSRQPHPAGGARAADLLAGQHLPQRRPLC